MGHIYGVKPGAARFRPDIPDTERDSFKNLLLFCLPHHADVDDKTTGESNYPVQLLRGWKTRREGKNGPALAALGQIDEDSLDDLLASAFAGTTQRLQDIADQLERTGTLNAQALLDLRQIISVMTEATAGPDVKTAMMLTEAAGMLARLNLATSAVKLVDAADALGKARAGITSDINRLTDAAETLHRAAGSY